ncbi:MAG: hypothetical protein Q8N31_04540 [Reyranella sp.]|nr:hypothetical protein [Reyranella sp.]
MDEGRAINCTHAATQRLGPCSSFMKVNTDHSIATSLGRRGERPFDDWLHNQLHEMYDSVAQEPLPCDLARLIGDTSEPASQ